MNDEQKLEYVKEHIGTYENFPKQGILFRDIFTALRDGKTCIYLRDLLVTHVKQHHPDVELIIGLDSRGFLFNLLVAVELGIGCAPIRKRGKLPGECISVDYALEYGTDVFEMQTAAFKPGQKIIIIDDLLATGGSLEAALKLVRKAGGDVLECLVVMELTFLEGRKKLDNCNIHSLVKY